MSDLNSFTELIKRGVEDKHLREEKELSRKIEENIPLLSELFKTVANAKQKVVEPVRISPEVTKAPQIDTKTIELMDTIGKFEGVLKRLQNDFVMLSRSVTEIGNRSRVSHSTAGSGEVRILRMDDVVRETPNPNDVMVWDESINKFAFISQASMLSVTQNVINEETIIPDDTSYQVISYLHLKAPLILHGNVKIT